MSEQAKYVVNVPWGSFGPSGWLPNRLLPMSAAEQYRQNLEAGYFARFDKPPAPPN